MKVKGNKILKIILCLFGICLFTSCGLITNYNYISFYKIFNLFHVKSACAVYDNKNYSKLFINNATTITKSANKSFVHLDCFIDDKQFKYASYVQVELLEKPNDILLRLFDFGANMVFSEDIEGANVLYIYIPLLPKFKIVKSKKVNLQIVSYKDSCLIGYPMIYTAY